MIWTSWAWRRVSSGQNAAPARDPGLARADVDAPRWRPSARRSPIAIYLATTSLKGVSSVTFHRDLGITQETAWHLSHRIREAWQRNGPPTFTQIGGKEKSKHASKGLRAGRGTVGKIAEPRLECRLLRDRVEQLAQGL